MSSEEEYDHIIDPGFCCHALLQLLADISKCFPDFLFAGVVVEKIDIFLLFHLILLQASEEVLAILLGQRNVSQFLPDRTLRSLVEYLVELGGAEEERDVLMWDKIVVLCLSYDSVGLDHILYLLL